MKNAAIVFLLMLSTICLAMGTAVPAQAEVASIGMLPVQDESGDQIPQKLLHKIEQDFKEKLTLSYQDVLVRPVKGASETSGMQIDRLTALGRQQGVRYLLRSGILGIKSDSAQSCDVGLYAELIAVDSGAVTSLRANGTGAEASAAIDDVRRWEAYNFKSSAFARTSLGQALGAALDQLAQQVYQTLVPSGQAAAESMPAETQPRQPAGEEGAASYEDDQELQQVIAEAESLVASGAAEGRDITSLQQALEGLRSSLDNKVSLMTQGQDTGAVDQEIAQRKTDLQNIIASSTQEAVAQPPEGEPQPESAEMSSGIAKVNELLSEALNCILKIQEIRTALMSFSQDQAPLPGDMEGAYLPVEEPTSDISGVVADDAGNPVEGATVIDPVSGASATTDSSGSYIIPHIPSGRFATMKVLKDGRELSAGKVQLQPGRMAIADWRIRSGGAGMKATGVKILPSNVIIASKAGAGPARTGAIKGVVRDAKGKPVARALVMVRGVGMVRTDSQGRYMFANVPQGAYQVLVRTGGATVQTQQVAVAARKVVQSKTVYQGTAMTSPALGKQAVLTRGAGAGLKGKVSAGSRQPLPGAKVTAVYTGGALSVFADSKGNYEFKGLKQGTYRLLARKSGYQEASGTVALKGAQSVVRDFTLEKSSAEIQKALAVKPAPAPGRAKVPMRTTGERAAAGAKGHLSGVVRDARSGKPIEDATVQVYGQQSVRTDRRGIFRISDVQSGNCRVAATHRNYQMEARTVTVRSNHTSTEDFSLKSMERQDIKTTTTPLLLQPAAGYGQVRGRITDSRTGKPVAQATVTLGSQKTRSGSSGDYSFARIPAGSHSMTFEKTNYQDGSRRITVQAGKTATAHIRLVPKLNIPMQKILVH
jgi:protocatechuate 3,4-dioxygenase beta subunit